MHAFAASTADAFYQADTQTTSSTTTTTDSTWTVVAAILDFVLGSILGSCIAFAIFKFRGSRFQERFIRRLRQKKEEWFPIMEQSQSVFADARVEDAQSTTEMVPLWAVYWKKAKKKEKPKFIRTLFKRLHKHVHMKKYINFMWCQDFLRIRIIGYPFLCLPPFIMPHISYTILYIHW